MYRLRSIAQAGTVAVFLLTACSVKHAPPASAVFLIESREGTLHLISPSLPGGVEGPAIPFSQIIPREYGYNPWEEYVDLSQGMRLSVVRMIGKTETTSSFYGVLPAGRRGVRIRNLGPDPERFDRRARYARLFYQTKFLASPGQPVRPALCLWADSVEDLAARTSEAKENPGYSCGHAATHCLSFPGRTTVSPELRVLVNQVPRYVLLGSTVRDLLRSNKVSESADIHVFRKYNNHMVPVKWQQKLFVQSLPLIGGDEISW